MNFIQTLINNYKTNKQIKKEQKEESERIADLNRILDQKIPTANIIKCENYLNQIEYFLMEMAPYGLKFLLAAGLETDCTFVQLTGEDAGEEFCIPKPCFLAEQKNKIPAYFLLNNSGNLSVAVNSYANYDIECGLDKTELEQRFGKTMTIRQIMHLRDKENGYEAGESIDLADEKFVACVVRLEDCSKIVRREDYENSSRKS